MSTILQINTSLFASNGQSSKLVDGFVATLAARPGTTVIKRDLAAAPVPHLDGERFGAFIADPAARTPAQKDVVAFSDTLVDEVRRADVLVIGAPMYNFGVPSQLKAWFDHIARVGVTFRYTETGPVGLLTGKKAIVVSTRGGVHVGQSTDTLTGYVRTFLGFLGITDVEFVYAEAIAYGDDARDKAVGQAAASLDTLASKLAA